MTNFLIENNKTEYFLLFRLTKIFSLIRKEYLPMLKNHDKQKFNKEREEAFTLETKKIEYFLN